MPDKKRQQELREEMGRVELVILAGQYKTVACYQNALRLPLPENNAGLVAR